MRTSRPIAAAAVLVVAGWVPAAALLPATAQEQPRPFTKAQAEHVDMAAVQHRTARPPKAEIEHDELVRQAQATRAQSAPAARSIASAAVLNVPSAAGGVVVGLAAGVAGTVLVVARRGRDTARAA